MGHVRQQEAVCGKQCDLISHRVALDNPELPLLSLPPDIWSLRLTHVIGVGGAALWSHL